MRAYDGLAPYYDDFNADVPYDGILAFYKELFARAGIRPALVLDLACGTGNMSLRLAAAGYEVIGVDISPEMLAQASAKTPPEGAVAPIYLCQPMEALDLYGTVDAALCCLDGVGYVTDVNRLREAFRRVCLFLNPGGVFIFDINSAYRLKNLDGAAFTRENEEAFCVYQADFGRGLLTYTLELFEKTGKLYRRRTEYHRERAYELDTLGEYLRGAGFDSVEFFGDCRASAPAPEEGRVFIMARKGE